MFMWRRRALLEHKLRLLVESKYVEYVSRGTVTSRPPMLKFFDGMGTWHCINLHDIQSAHLEPDNPKMVVNIGPSRVVYWFKTEGDAIAVFNKL